MKLILEIVSNESAIKVLCAFSLVKWACFWTSESAISGIGFKGLDLKTKLEKRMDESDDETNDCS